MMIQRLTKLDDLAPHVWALHVSRARRRGKGVIGNEFVAEYQD